MAGALGTCQLTPTGYLTEGPLALIARLMTNAPCELHRTQVARFSFRIFGACGTGMKPGPGLGGARPVVQHLSKLDVSLNQHVMLGAEMLLKRLQRGNSARDILLAVTPTQADAANHFAVDHDREAADEHRKAPFKAELNSECLVTRQRRSGRCLVEEMRRALVACGGERLVPGNLRSGDARAVHALDQHRMTAVVGDADGFEHLDLRGLRDCRRRHQSRLDAFELECLSHIVVSSA